MPNFCAAPNCTRKSTQSDLAFFRFPRDPIRRCKLWVENCRRADLEDKTSDQLNKHYRLCAKHFEPSMICKSSPYRTVLKDNAVPTIFDLTSHLNNPHSRHRKRIKEFTEEELRKMKERRLEILAEQEQLNKEHESSLQNQTHECEESEEDLVPLTPEEKEIKDYLKSLFEILVMMGKQNIPLDGHGDEEEDSESFTPSNFQALLEYRINAGDEILRKRFEMTAVNVEYCPILQQKQMMEICESCIREEVLREVRECRFFSLVTDDVVEVTGECHLPLFLRFVDEANNLREEFIGFFPCEADEDTLAERLHAEITEKWGLNMEYCRGQAHVCSGHHAVKIKAVGAKLMEKYPLAVCTPCSSCSLNIWLAKGLPLPSVQIVLLTLKKIDTFFSKSPLLLAELENSISVVYQNNEDKANELRELCRTQWTERHDAFDTAVDLLESLLLCVDSVNENESFRWNNDIAFEAYMISESLADFEFVVTLVILKNALSFTRAFGKNLQGQTLDVFFAASSLTAVLHSLNEIMDNIEVYHEFWFEEATILAARLEIPVKLPRTCLRRNRMESGFEVVPESFYKEYLSIPVVVRIIQELKDIFSDNHLKALKCLSLVPSVMGQLKFNTSEENNADMYRSDLPNPDTLPAELHCWRIKWKHRGKDVELPSTIYETLHLSEVKFFPNVYSFLKVLCTLPIIKVENNKYESGRKRLKAYLSNTPVNHRSKSLALLNINYDVKHDLDLMVDTYTKMYPEKTDQQ
ncbi:52 kDa repressor of the inhibitor of the protein kinase-like isoform X1 [Erpetoichthys calabaricus]|uniref:52 kDa repressor of the inhibitor of the protein kinase-like isoform X1 n=1 Tax=Erpetoichthys calabaricus TaxID=27687 RepID=UPI00109FE2DC|nr:52 kDa repressor of the inhibitor of the protein kinase-like isoform X1 [Erpetoichthys calabaricus]